MLREAIARRALAAVLAAGAFAFGALAALTPTTWAPAVRVTAVDTPRPAFYRGFTVLITNAVVYSDLYADTVQDLTGCTITLYIGTPGDATNFAGTIADAESGTFWGWITIPTNAPDVQFLQVRIADGVITNVYPPISFELKNAL